MVYNIRFCTGGQLGMLTQHYPSLCPQLVGRACLCFCGAVGQQVMRQHALHPAARQIRGTEQGCCAGSPVAAKQLCFFVQARLVMVGSDLTLQCLSALPANTKLLPSLKGKGHLQESCPGAMFT